MAGRNDRDVRFASHKEDDALTSHSGSTSASSPIEAWGTGRKRATDDDDYSQGSDNVRFDATAHMNSVGSDAVDETPLGQFRHYMTEGPGAVPYGAVACFIVVANMVVLGIETDVGCMSGSDCLTSEKSRGIFLYLDVFFAVVFVFEHLLRAVVQGPTTYFLGFSLDPRCFRTVEFTPSHKTYRFYYPVFNVFNMIDLMLVLFRVIDVIMRMAGNLTLLKIVTALRVINVGFVTLNLKGLQSTRELWLILATFGDTIKAVMWVFFILLIVLYVMAIYFTTVLGQSQGALSVELDLTDWTMQDHWSSVPASLYTLVQMMTLDKWAVGVMFPVIRKYPMLMFPVVVFLVITGICLLNMITGVVVENTLSNARNNAERESLQTQKLNWKILQSMERLFHESDTDGSGSIDREELQAMLKNPRVRDRLMMLEIPLKDFDMLFTLLDDTRSGGVPIDKFFRGAGRLRGVATAADLHHMGVDLARHTTTAKDLAEKVAANNESLAWLLDEVDNVDREIVKGEADESDPVLKARKGRAKTTTRASRLRKKDSSDDEPSEAISRLTSKRSVQEVRRPSLLSSALRAAANESNAAFRRASSELGSVGAGSGAKLQGPPAAQGNGRSASKGQRSSFHWGVN